MLTKEKFERWWSNKIDVAKIAYGDDFDSVENLVRHAFDAGFWSASEREKIDPKDAAEALRNANRPVI